MPDKTKARLSTSERIDDLLNAMTLSEKIGQLSLLPGGDRDGHDELLEEIKQGRIGGVLNEVDPERVADLQRAAVNESRLGIPLLVGRDVVHGFKTVFPIPLGLAACWNGEIVESCARVSALEASQCGINWTYAPMLDIGRDPRWGRIAETFGEDPHLIAELGKAMIAGFQGDDLSTPGNIAACAKHFVGYGASEAGRDYNTTNIPLNELYNVHLRPFRSAIEAGVTSVMTSFSDFDGVPVTANQLLLRTVLREVMEFTGMIVSDWEAVSQLSVHGLTESEKQSAEEAAIAGVDMEMTSRTYSRHLEELIAEGRIDVNDVDHLVRNVLTVKARLGLLEDTYESRTTVSVPPLSDCLETAYEAAVKSIVLLTNKEKTLPINISSLTSIAVIGPMADEPYEQLGTWVFDGDPGRSETPLQTLKERFGSDVRIAYARGMTNTRTRDRSGFSEAVWLAQESDAVLLFLGEESILSGEAHCRASIRLPGCQEALVEELATTGKPIIAVVMAGRPLVLRKVVDAVGAILYAWHPGAMAGPALIDLITGRRVPSGKLPVTFPRMTGQIPIYCAHKNTGRPATHDTHVSIDDIPQGAFQTSVGNTSFHFDAGYTPEFPLGYGLSYTEFEYRDIRLSTAHLRPKDTLRITAKVTNRGAHRAEEVVQLYIRDLVGSVTRPVKELRGFRRVELDPGETRSVEFSLSATDLAFYNRNLQFVAEPGTFHVWIGGCSDTKLRAEFELLEG